MLRRRMGLDKTKLSLKMKKIRVIGDLHQGYRQYLNVIHNAEHSVCVGDVGFDYEPIKHLNPDKHVWVMGNHENYDKCFAYPHCLGDYGTYELNGIAFFFVRGGFSIDWAYRVRHEQLTGEKIWWKDEELSQVKMYECLDLYKSVKPEFVITHECPRSISRRVGSDTVLRNFGYEPDSFTTNTRELLESMFQVYQPSLWIFGHYHRKKQVNEGRTRFICLPEYGYCDVNDKLEVMGLKF